MISSKLRHNYISDKNCSWGFIMLLFSLSFFSPFLSFPSIPLFLYTFNLSYQFPSLSSLEMIVLFSLLDFNSEMILQAWVFEMRKKKRITGQNKCMLSVLWQKYSENLARPRAPPQPFLFMRCSVYRFIFVSCSILFFSTYQEMGAARALINGFKFPLFYCKARVPLYILLKRHLLVPIEALLCESQQTVLSP